MLIGSQNAEKKNKGTYFWDDLCNYQQDAIDLKVILLKLLLL